MVLCSGDIVNCTIADNTAGVSGGGIAWCGSATITNCVIWSNNLEQIAGGAPTYSCIQDWSASGEGNIATDPEFADPCNSDYHLKLGSFCIDAGTNSPPPGLPSEDLEGQFRPIDGDNYEQAVADMGCYESLPCPYPVIKLSAELFEFGVLLDGANPDDQILTVRNSGGGTLNWGITYSDCDWLTVHPISGSSTGEPNNVTLSVDASGVSEGLHTCQLTVFDPSAENSPQTIDVYLYMPVEVLVPDDYGTIQAAVSAAATMPPIGSTCVLITIAPDTYYENVLITGDNQIVLRSSNASDPAVVTSTIIDGGLSNSVIRILDCDTVIDGFVITHGKADNGGGIYCTGTADVSIKNCIIDDNKANDGADGYWINTGPPFYEYYYYDGEDGGSGGGIYCSGNIALQITNSAIKNNRAGLGGDGIDFYDHWTIPGDGGHGGGIYCLSSSSLTVKNCTLEDNSAGRGGWGYEDGGYGGHGGAIYSDNSCYIENCQINNNSAGDTGDNGSDISHLVSHAGDGGGIYIGSSGSLDIRNSLITGNAAGNGGAACAIEYSSSAGGDGGGIYSNVSDTLVENCTIVNNQVGLGIVSGAGGGIYGQLGATIINSIIWGNGDDLANCSATYSCIEDNDSGAGNIHDGPLFVTGPMGDYYLNHVAAGQDSNSPCVDAGSDTAANLGMDEYTTRTDQVTDAVIVDMGYHYVPLLENVADINGDWYVNEVDLLLMALQWLDAPGIPSADLAPVPLDNFVDYQDFGVIQQNWQWPQ